MYCEPHRGANLLESSTLITGAPLLERAHVRPFILESIPTQTHVASRR